MSNRIQAFGTTLSYKDGASAAVTVAGLTNIESPSASTDEIDGTAHDSPAGAREVLPGFTDYGETPIEGYYDPNDASHKNAGLPTIFKTKKIVDWTITLGGVAAKTITFKGWIKSFQTTHASDGLHGFTGTIRATGPVTYP